MPSNKCSYPTPCWYPRPERLEQYSTPDGKKPKLKFRDPENSDYEAMTIPCRTCPNCLYTYATQWSIRAACEMQLHEQNTFVTLTYADAPDCGNLIPTDFKNFIRRLKDAYPSHKIRYLYSGERGGLRGRPHFHAILFGIDFEDKTPDRPSQSGAPMWHSQKLTDIWKHGIAVVGEANANTAAYVCQYVVKKLSDDYDGSTNKSRPAEHIDTETGDIIEYNRKGDYIAMSRMPGIGHDWFLKYKNDIFPSCTMQINIGGDIKSVAIPPYFYSLLKKYDSDLYEEVQHKRMLLGIEYQAKNPLESTPARLLAKATCAADNRKQLSRKMDTDKQSITPEQTYINELKIKHQRDARLSLLKECNIQISRLYCSKDLDVDNPDFYQLQRFRQLHLKNEAVKRLKRKIETKTKMLFEEIYRNNNLNLPSC